MDMISAMNCVLVHGYFFHQTCFNLTPTDDTPFLPLQETLLKHFCCDTQMKRIIDQISLMHLVSIYIIDNLGMAWQEKLALHLQYFFNGSTLKKSDQLSYLHVFLCGNLFHLKCDSAPLLHMQWMHAAYMLKMNQAETETNLLPQSVPGGQSILTSMSC